MLKQHSKIREDIDRQIDRQRKLLANKDNKYSSTNNHNKGFLIFNW